jgi:hypothetical protein
MVSRVRGSRFLLWVRVGFKARSESRGSCWSRCSGLVGSGLGVRAGIGTRRLRARVGSEALGVCGFGLGIWARHLGLVTSNLTLWVSCWVQ